MRKLFITALATASLLFGFTSCNEDIQLSGDFQETAVVYGLLDVSDNVHMIKITRAFIGPGNSELIADNPDSSYFNDVVATISEKVNNIVVRSWTLQDTIVTNKEINGVWYAPEQKLFYFNTDAANPLRDDAIYDLNISINGGEFEVNGSTPIVYGLSTTAANTTFSFKFAQNVNDYKNTAVTVNTGSGNNKAAVINTKIEVGYEEITGIDTVIRAFDWDLGEQEVGIDATKGFAAQGAVFYDLIKRHIDANDNPICDKRNLSYLRLKIVGGGPDLYNYMVVNEPSSAIVQTKPTYTNLEATNGYTVIGIFSSTQTLDVVKTFHSAASQFVRCIDKNSTLELCTGSYTGPYIFCSDHPTDVAFGYSWACN
jgi:hypothetical protein